MSLETIAIQETSSKIFGSFPLASQYPSGNIGRYTDFISSAIAHSYLNGKSYHVICSTPAKDEHIPSAEMDSFTSFVLENYISEGVVENVYRYAVSSDYDSRPKEDKLKNPVTRPGISNFMNQIKIIRQNSGSFLIHNPSSKSTELYRIDFCNNSRTH